MNPHLMAATFVSTFIYHAYYTFNTRSRYILLLIRVNGIVKSYSSRNEVDLENFIYSLAKFIFFKPVTKYFQEVLFILIEKCFFNSRKLLLFSKHMAIFLTI